MFYRTGWAVDGQPIFVHDAPVVNRDVNLVEVDGLILGADSLPVPLPLQSLLRSSIFSIEQ